jgi:SSS family solute:Na+ symporter
LAPADLAIVVAYLAAVIGMSWVIARRQHTGTDYFLAGRSMRAAPLGASILANQASAISLVGAPAFVALREGGGLRWLQYELALPLAMLLLIAWLLPVLRSVPGSSVYAYLEQRFGRGTRQALAAAFLLSRGLALGVVLYASALVVAEATGVGVVGALLSVGLLSVAYTSLGGIVADIWSDVLQLCLLWVGTLASAIYLLTRQGVVAAVPAERMQTLVLEFGPHAQTFALGPMLLGGFFLYLSYYACDQSQAQRLLTARDDRAARRALVLNGLLRFPLVLTYCGFGLLLAGLLRVDPQFAERLAGRPVDSLVPVFITTYLPTGLRGLMLAAILAAAMSSIDSALNSLAAVTREDVLGHDPSSESVWFGRLTSFAWGLFAVAAGWMFSRTGGGVLELVNLVGSVFYGPVLGVFTLGVLAPGTRGRHAVAGLLAGLAVNVTLSQAAPAVSWLWWNPAGWLGTITIGSLLAMRPWRVPRWAAARGESLLLLGGFLVMLAMLALLARSNVL